MATHTEHLEAEFGVSAGSLRLLLTLDLASVDDVSVAAARGLVEADDDDLLFLAAATGRDRVDVLENLAHVEPSDFEVDAVRLAAILVALDDGFEEWEIAAIRSQFDDPEDMERTSPHFAEADSSYLGPEGETRAVVEALRSRLRQSPSG